jgi:hypothetical protein
VIRVVQAPEPPEFDRTVRQRGLNAIAEMVGETPAEPRRGRRRPKVADHREDIPAAAFPDFWCDVLPQLRESYNGLCAYLAMRIDPATGAGTVDHFVPKKVSWEKVYEWSNYRLSSAVVNGWKGTKLLPYDPFELPEELCALEFVAFQVKPGNAAIGPAEQVVDHMINEQLRLNERPCRTLREQYFNDYMAGGINLHVLRRDAPFIAMELRRQGMLRPGDS